MNNLNGTITGAFIYEFEWRCVSLLIESYFHVKSNYPINIDCEEEYISAVIFDYIDKCPQSSKWNIDITPEYRLYKDEILKKKKTAKTSSRIDLRFCGWTNNLKQTYFIEAKNLIETDTPKKGRKSKISANYLHQRYIETGIDNYLSDRYPPNGCLAGYILQGNIENIIISINNHLSNQHRETEILVKQCFGLPNVESCYLSTHENERSIKHLNPKDTLPCT